MSLKKISKLPDVDILKMFFRYEDGKLIRNEIDESLLKLTGFTLRGLRRWNSTLANKEAGHECKRTGAINDKVRQVRINYKLYFEHRVIYKLCTGEEPILIDHINGDPLDNRVENLRSVTNMENMRNTKKFKTNTSGHVGVSWSKQNSKWEAYIWNNCTKINLGLFENIQDAVDKRKEYELLLSYHENHGRN